jgi:adenosylcobinamide kinase / adenosylcobinamide-phosphate guanylyltransferase
VAATLQAEKPLAVILIGGGARSGKSRYALSLAQERGKRLGFIATGQAYDDEMRDRIAAHRRERDPAFTTLEEPVDIAGALANTAFDVVVVDCLTLWLSNILDRDVEREFDNLISAARESAAVIIFVTNEVGCGIVPDNALARRFRDHAGCLNNRIAAIAGEVYWMVFGCPLKVK